MEELIHIDNLCSRCGFFTSDTSVNGGYGCNHKDCDDGEYIYNGDIIDWHKAYRIVAIRLTKRNIKCNRRLAKKFLKKARFSYHVKSGTAITIDGDTIEFYGGTITYPFFGQRSIRDMVIKEKGD